MVGNTRRFPLHIVVAFQLIHFSLKQSICSALTTPHPITRSVETGGYRRRLTSASIDSSHPLSDKSYRSSTLHHAHANNINNDGDEDGNSPIEPSPPSPTRNLKSSTTTRRSAIHRSLLTTTATLLTTSLSPQSSSALSLPFLPQDTSTTDDSIFQPAKRATAYLVDSTRPPTLVPYRAAREAAILKNIGNGKGTQKTAFLEDEITTNNMMNKAVFGTGNLISDTLFSLGVDVEGDAAPPVTPEEIQKVEEEEAARKKRRNERYDSTYVFLGVDYADTTGDDANLAIGIMEIMLRPRRNLESTLALDFAPLSTQDALDAYLLSAVSSPPTSPQKAKDTLTQKLIDAKVPASTVQTQMPILEYARGRSLRLLACGPESDDRMTVRRRGLQNLDPDRRSRYVADSTGFIEWTQDPKNRLYTDRSLLKDYVPLAKQDAGDSNNSETKSEDEGEDNIGGYFAERILTHEAIATTLARHSLTLQPKSLTITISPITDVRFLGGPNGRIPRILKALNPKTNVDEEAVTTILLNPTAKKTLSKSRFLRLEIGTSPANLVYQTKVADYLWFTRMPAVNMLPRMMNGY